jgi:phytoene/squalene synthetase
MPATLASAITRAASSQTYYTIRFLVDRPLRDDAFRAYAYFRWVDDILDAPSPTPPSDAGRAERLRFLKRQQSLLEACLDGQPPGEVDLHEAMLVELLRAPGAVDPRLAAYARHLMAVMAFDAQRRGRLVTEAELEQYTRSLAIAVTEAMHHFIGNRNHAPAHPSRYLAVSGAHIVHMLRDTYQDMRAGYYNVPRELLDGHAIASELARSDPYRSWVAARVNLAREHFEAGKAYFAQLACARHRLAGLAYIARFEWLMGTIEREGFLIRPAYDERRSLSTGVRMGGHLLASILGRRAGHTQVRTIPGREERPA